MKTRSEKIDESLMSFEICGEKYMLSEYDKAIDIHRVQLSAYYKELKEFPYSVRKITGNNVEITKNIPVFILHKKDRISLYDFISDILAFEDSLPLSKETNGLEVKNDLELSFRHIKTKDDYHSVIYETFRVLQDLHYLLATSRWALIQAHRKLHFRSGLVWGNGGEQLWTRATWLNNAIVMYDSCFDKILQAVWIGTESFTQKKGKNYSRASLFKATDLESVYHDCWRRDNLNKIPEQFGEINNFMNSNSTISNYAQKIKHRGGMRYEGLFPFGEISIVDGGYNPYTTRNTMDIDDVVKELKAHHIALITLVNSVTEKLINVFKQHGYLTGEDIEF
ncbi:MAG: hypothetical protein MJZ85_09420 [Bacteroidales bacterium]|nr:hypothetical protein [Bacteroidales bacterium]